jgi:hypothetical protein
MLGARLGFGARGMYQQNFSFDVKFGDGKPDDWNLVLYDMNSLVWTSVVAGAVGGRSSQSTAEAAGQSADAKNSFGALKNPEGWTRGLLSVSNGTLALRYAVPGGRWTYPTFVLPADTRDHLSKLYSGCGKKLPG